MLNFFCFSSKRIIKQFRSKDFLTYIGVCDEPFIISVCKIRGFFLALLTSYFKFLCFRFKRFFNPENENYYSRDYFLINTYFKHILVVEWGFYNEDSGAQDAYSGGLWLLQNKDTNYFRPHNVAEYDCTNIDLNHPLHKSQYDRYWNRYFIKSPYLGLVPRFFFNFFVILPVSAPSLDISRPSNQLFLTDNIPEPPLKVNYPILFELFLLKFTICSFLFCTSSSRIYEFYSLGLLESVLLRFQEIYYLIFDFYYGKMFKSSNLSLLDLKLAFLKLEFFRRTVFYGNRSTRYLFPLSLFAYNRVIKEFNLSKIQTKFKLFNFVVKNFFFTIMCIYTFNYVSFIDLNLLHFAELLLNGRFIFVVGLIIFVFVVYFITRVVKYSWLMVFISYFAQGFFSSIIPAFTGILSYLFLIVALKELGCVDYGYILTICVALSLILISISNIHNAINIYIGHKIRLKKRKKLQFLSPDSSPLILFLPILTFPILFLLKLFIDGGLWVCFLAKSYTPDVYLYNHVLPVNTSYNTLVLSQFQVPFYGISWPSICYPYSFDCTDFQLIDEITLDQLGELIPGRLQASFYWKRPYFIKFLLDKNNNLVEVQYNHFKVGLKDFCDCSYQFMDVFYFPPKLIYFLQIFWFFLLWTLLNLKVLLLLNIFGPRRSIYSDPTFIQFLEGLLIIKHSLPSNALYRRSNLYRTNFVFR